MILRARGGGGEKAGVRVDIAGWEEVPGELRGKQQEATASTSLCLPGLG